jgi:hypothetical protein
LALRFSLPRVSRQGYGLGNELVPWARAFLAAQVLDAILLPPAFGLNRRGYWRDFYTAPDDWIYNRAIERLLPKVEFNEADYLEHGGGDVVPALRRFAQAQRLHERSMFVLVTEGLWGGFHHVQAAREFMRSTLYRSRYAARNLLALRERFDSDKILVAMHVRLGDFRAPSERAAYRCSANVSLPLEWFRSIALSLRAALGNEVQFLLVSDGTRAQLQPLLDAGPWVTTADLPHGDCSDVLALADADLLVCSASTYSHLAAFLSDAPYLWFAPNLHPHAEGCYSLGDPSTDLQRPDSARMRAIRRFTSAESAVPDFGGRGAAVDLDGAVPPALIETLRQRHAYRRWERDLVRGGVVPGGAGGDGAGVSSPPAGIS